MGGGGDNQVCKTRFVLSNVRTQALNNLPLVVNMCTFLFIDIETYVVARIQYQKTFA